MRKGLKYVITVSAIAVACTAVGTSSSAASSTPTSEPTLTQVSPPPTMKDGELPPLDNLNYTTKTLNCSGHRDYLFYTDVKAVVQDYGPYSVIKSIKVRGREDKLADMGSPTIGMTVRSSSGSILRSAPLLVGYPDTWYERGAPSGSVGDGGSIRATTSWSKNVVGGPIVVGCTIPLS